MKLLLLAAACALLPIALHAKDPEPPQPQRLSDGIWLIPGSFPLDRQPDGNTVIFEGRSGFIVMDTGRHAWHRQAIIDFVKNASRPVTAIINSHWHLDHTSGNAALKQLHPRAKLYTGTAVERMIRDVWPESLKRSQATLDAGKTAPGLAEDIRGDIETRRNAQFLKADVAITASGRQTIDGLALDFHFAPHAATDGDVWVYEPQSRVAAAGDLITLPVPFLDTACVRGWRTALQRMTTVPFATVIPGHGNPMNRAQFLTYKSAFDSYTDCATGTGDKAACAANWMKATVELRAPEAPDDARTLEMAQDYVDLLRENGGNAKLCQAR